jgi:HEAT repeat protein
MREMLVSPHEIDDHHGWERVERIKQLKAIHDIDGVIAEALDRVTPGDRIARHRAVAAAAELGGERARQLLIDLLDRDDPDDAVRATAARELAKRFVGEPGVTCALVEALRDSCGGVRSWAAHGLGRSGNPTVVEPLTRLLNDPYWFAQRSAVIALGDLGDASVLPALRDAERLVPFWRRREFRRSRRRLQTAALDRGVGELP